MTSCNGTSREYNLILDVNQVSQNIAGNYSTVAWSLRFTCGQYYYQNSSTTDNFKVYIDGQLVYNQNRAISFSGKNSSLTIASGQTNVSHNTDGTKAISFSCHFVPGRSASYYPGAINGSSSMSLTTIPRAGTLNSVSFNNFWSSFSASCTKYYSGFTHQLKVAYTGALTLQIFNNYNSGTSVTLNATAQDAIMKKLISSGSVNLYFILETYNGSTHMGNSEPKTITISKPTITQITSVSNFNVDEGFTITLSKSYPSYTSKLEMILSGTIVYSNTIGNSQKITFSSAQLQTIYNLMKTVNSATFTLRVTSLYGSTNCGSVSVNKTGTITNATPTLPGFTWETINHLDLHDNQTIIKGQSNIKVSIQQASSYKGAGIDYYQISIGNVSTKIETLETILNNCDHNVITVYAVDSRGNATSKQMVCNKYVEYKPVTIETLEYVRSSGGIGSGVTIQYSGSVHAGNFGIQDNQISAKYYYKEVSASDYIEGTTDIIPMLQSKYSKDVVIRGDLEANGFSIDKNFHLKVIVSDRLSSYSKEIILAKGTPALAIHEDGVSFGAFYDESRGGSLQVEGINIIDILHPIGSLIEFGDKDINPNTLPQFKGTTWTRFASGRVTVGLNTSDADFNTVAKVGGAKTFNNSHTHTMSHTHSINAHTHDQGNLEATIGATGSQPSKIGYIHSNLHNVNGYGKATYTISGTNVYTNETFNHWSRVIGDTGSRALTTNSSSISSSSSAQSSVQPLLQPYVVVSRWIRTK